MLLPICNNFVPAVCIVLHIQTTNPGEVGGGRGEDAPARWPESCTAQWEAPRLLPALQVFSLKPFQGLAWREQGGETGGPVKETEPR